jgi:hypothetical protein
VEAPNYERSASPAAYSRDPQPSERPPKRLRFSAETLSGIVTSDAIAVRNDILYSFEPLLARFASRRCFAVVNFPRRLLFLLSLIAFLAGTPVVATTHRDSVAPPAPALPSVIADFDGDLRPDTASIQSGRSDSSHAVYWIQLQLTSIGRQSIRLEAPVGGLQILARDVNGDRALDLVVTTAGLGNLVAVFLNDGHGGFSKVDQNAFPVSFNDSATDCASAPCQDSIAADAPPQSRTEIASETRTVFGLQSNARLRAFSNSESSLDRSLTCHPGRAPPFPVPQF